jgi:hypothetical protein
MTRTQWRRWLRSPMRWRWERMVQGCSVVETIWWLKFYTELYVLMLEDEDE